MNSYMQTWLDFTRTYLRFAQAWLEILDRELGLSWTSPTTSVRPDLRLVRSDEGSTSATGVK